VFDGQILFNYGLFSHKHICKKHRNNQFRLALNYPFENQFNQVQTIPVIYHLNEKIHHTKNDICLTWNLIDIFLYAIIPFLIALICSLIIIVKVCQRRQTTLNLGGRIYYQNHDVFQQSRHHLSTLLITTNLLFFLLTSPLNIYLIFQSIFDYFQSNILIEYLSLLQNSYHSLAFLFYCVIGNKFRNCAQSICRTIYLKCVQCKPMHCCFEYRRSSTSGNTISTTSHPRRLTYATYDVHQKTIGLICNDEQI